MPPALAALLANYRLQPTRARLVAHLGCEIHRVTAQASDGVPRELALRIYPPSRGHAGTIDAEVAWLAALAAEGLHVPRPLADVAGRVVQPWRPDAGVETRHAVLLTWLPGRMHDRGLTPARLRRVGTLTGHLHRVAGRLAATGRIGTARPAFHRDLARWEADAHDGPWMPGPRLRVLAREAARRLARELAALPKDDTAWGFVHGDLHPWNLLFERDVAGAIDFSDCGWGHVALDLASTLQYLRHPLARNHDHRGQLARLHAALLEGYDSVRALPPDIERQIDLYVVARMFVTLGWIVEDWPRPDHRAWGPAFLDGVEAVFDDFVRG